MVSTNLCDEFKEYGKECQLQIFKVMKFTFKTKFNHLLLSITFKDKF